VKFLNTEHKSNSELSYILSFFFGGGGVLFFGFAPLEPQSPTQHPSGFPYVII